MASAAAKSSLKKTTPAPPAPRGASLNQTIRNDIEHKIMSGEWPPGFRLPVEHDLMAHYGCSRMTVNKALGALSAQGLIIRRRRAGSVVAAPSADRAVLQIVDFAAEAQRSGKLYRHDMMERRMEEIDAATARRTGLKPGTRVLYAATRHVVDGVIEAYEERIVNLAAVPQARRESFADMPIGTWLLQRVPWSDAEHIIGAINADARLARRLGVERHAACLMLERRTWQNTVFLTEARLYYPGTGHRLVGRFSPTGNAAFGLAGGTENGRS
ncbi:MAG: UTRA domain-containing protein [Beijerinckiaceae bacterium]|nr:UTRA domain-containing protein [Beijerinckiaceae bacterium]